MDYFKKYSPFINLLVLFILVNIILRIVLLFHPITQSGFGILETFKIFAFGLLSDVLVFVIASALLWVYLLFLSNSKYEKPWGYIIFGCFLFLPNSYYNPNACYKQSFFCAIIYFKYVFIQFTHILCCSIWVIGSEALCAGTGQPQNFVKVPLSIS